MNRLVAGVYRALLRAYPTQFRREYGGEMLRLLDDELRHGPEGSLRTSARLVSDVVRTAPRMRWESNMNRVILVSCAIALAVVAFAIGSPVLLLGLLATALLVYLAVVHNNPDRSITAPPERARGWYWWLLAAVGFVFAGFAVLTIDGEQLTEIGWPLLMLSWGAAIVMAVIGIILGITHLAHRRSDAQPPAAAAG